MVSTTETLEELDCAIARLESNEQVVYMPGTCKSSTCKQSKHPDECDGAFENGDLQPLPEKPTMKEMREAFLMLRADLSESLKAMLGLIKGQQNQVVFLDKFAKGHRHKVGEGHFSDKADS